MRFTLAACLALTAFLAVICFLLTTQPSVAAYFLLVAITILAPVCAVAGIVYGRDNLRAFCIGAALPLALLVWSSSQELREISFDPAAYGWSKRGEQVTENINVRLAREWLASNGAPTTGGSGVSRWQEAILLARSPVQSRTLDRAQAMTGPTCSLSIAAVVCGVLVMAIRGGLARKEPTAGE